MKTSSRCCEVSFILERQKKSGEIELDNALIRGAICAAAKNQEFFESSSG